MNLRFPLRTGNALRVEVSSRLTLQFIYISPGYSAAACSSNTWKYIPNFITETGLRISFWAKYSPLTHSYYLKLSRNARCLVKKRNCSFEPAKPKYPRICNEGHSAFYDPHSQWNVQLPQAGTEDITGPSRNVRSLPRGEPNCGDGSQQPHEWLRHQLTLGKLDLSIELLTAGTIEILTTVARGKWFCLVLFQSSIFLSIIPQTFANWRYQLRFKTRKLIQRQGDALELLELSDLEERALRVFTNITFNDSVSSAVSQHIEFGVWSLTGIVGFKWTPSSAFLL